MFRFFINLSGDYLFIWLKNHKNQSNIIPEAIHLCDGLMASGYPEELYCMLMFIEHSFIIFYNLYLSTNS